jgi:hypothetical protein
MYLQTHLNIRRHCDCHFHFFTDLKIAETTTSEEKLQFLVLKLRWFWYSRFKIGHERIGI